MSTHGRQILFNACCIGYPCDLYPSWSLLPSLGLARLCWWRDEEDDGGSVAEEYLVRYRARTSLQRVGDDAALPVEVRPQLGEGGRVRGPHRKPDNMGGVRGEIGLAVAAARAGRGGETVAASGGIRDKSSPG